MVPLLSHAMLIVQSDCGIPHPTSLPPVAQRAVLLNSALGLEMLSSHPVSSLPPPARHLIYLIGEIYQWHASQLAKPPRQQEAGLRLLSIFALQQYCSTTSGS